MAKMPTVTLIVTGGRSEGRMGHEALLDWDNKLRNAAPDKFWDVAGELFASIGIKGFSYGAVVAGTNNPLETINDLIFKNNYSREWREQVEEKYNIYDEFGVRALAHGHTVVDWNIPDDDPLHTPITREIYAIESDLGMQWGRSALLTNDTQRGSISGFGMWTDAENEAQHLDVLRVAGPLGMELAMLIDSIVLKDRVVPLVQLTNRELDALRYFAVGLRGDEVAWRMGISDKTLEKHVASAKRKLRARTRDHLIARAITTGILQF